jgi:hypothetical protein
MQAWGQKGFYTGETIQDWALDLETKDCCCHLNIEHKAVENIWEMIYSGLLVKIVWGELCLKV